MIIFVPLDNTAKDRLLGFLAAHKTGLSGVACSSESNLQRSVVACARAGVCVRVC